MKKSFSFLFLILLTVLMMVSCGNRDKQDLTTRTPGTTVAPDTTTGITTVVHTTETPIMEAKVESITLHFTDTKVCASKHDTKSSVEGTPVQWDRWYSTDYIDISSYYGLFYELGSHKYLMSLSFYTQNKEYISGVGTDSTSDAAMINGFIVIPEKAVYIRAITFTGINSQNATSAAHIEGYVTQTAFDTAASGYPYKDLVVACIGDSLTEGDIGSYYGGADRTFGNYPYYLGKELGCTVINYGKCGYTAEMIYNMYNQGLIDISYADVILVMLGTNAGLQSSGMAQYNAYLSLIDQIQDDMKPDAKIILITPPYAARRLGCYAFVEEAAKTVVTIGRDEKLPVIDAHNESPIQQETETLYQPNDGLHMVETGYKVFAHFIAEKMLSIINAQ